MNGIYFPGVGVGFDNVSNGFSLFGLDIKFYAIVITLGFLIGGMIACREARLSGQDPEAYQDFVIALMIPAIIGARIYFIIFKWSDYVSPGKSLGQILLDMINIRNGGLAVYGGLIAGTITALIFAKMKKMTLPLMWDTVSMGVLFGQMLGRWGNFFNREVFGAYTHSFMRMAIPIEYFKKINIYDAYVREGMITNEMLANTETVNGVECITVHPTFLYEGLLNLLVLIIILLYRRKKHFDGEIGLMYMGGYGICRFIVEGIRTDNLKAGSFKVSQVLAAVCIVLAVVIWIWNMARIKRGVEPKLHPILSGKKKQESSDKNTEI